MDEGLRGGPAAGGDDLTHEKRVIPRWMLGRQPAFDPAEGALDQRRPQLAVAGLDPDPEADRRHAAREVLRQVLLSRSEDAQPEQASTNGGMVR